MSYNGSGTFNINTTGQPVVAGTVISSSAFNSLTSDLATGLSTAITKDGQTTTTARITFAQGITSSLVTDSSSVSTGSIITAGGVGIAKALYVGGIASFSAQPIFTSLTASSAVATDASKGLVSVTNTGTGNNVLATSPTITTPTISSLSSASATALTLQSAGTTAVTVDTSQRVIVGYTASVGTAYQTNIQVKGNSASGYAGYGVTTSNNESAGLFGAYSNGENSLWIASDPDNLRAGSRTVFTVDGTQTAQINPFGIGVGSATPTSGTGITFPATQSASSDANTLDDYEEGTYTPAIQGTSTNPTVVYSIQKGQYTKVGNRVFISFDVAWSAFTGGSGSLAVTVPFAITSAQLGGNFSFGYVSGLSSNTLTGYNDPGNSYFYLTNSTSTSNNLNVSTAGASGRITGVGSYQV